MSFIRWIHTIYVLGVSGAVTGVFVLTTGICLVHENDVWRLVRLERMESILTLAVCIAIFILAWLMSVVFFHIKYRQALNLMIFEMESRSFWFFTLLSVDLVRFFPLPLGWAMPCSMRSLILHRILTLLAFSFALFWVKMKQHKALLAGLPEPRKGVRSITWIAGISVMVFWIISSQFQSARSSEVTLKILHCLSFDRWISENRFELPVRECSGIALPAGRYEVSLESTIAGALWTVDSPVVPDMPMSDRKTRIYNIPIDTHQFALVTDRSLETSARLVIQAQKIFDLSADVRPWVPRIYDDRFSGITLPYPWKAYLYRLDNNAYPLEDEGFWIRSDRTSRFTMVSKNPIRRMEMYLHSIEDTSARFRQADWVSTVKLKPDHIHTMDFIPGTVMDSPDIWIYPFEITVSGGGVTAGDRDERSLGVFVRLVDKGISGEWYRTAFGIEEHPVQRIESLMDVHCRQVLKPWSLLEKYYREPDSGVRRVLRAEMSNLQPGTLDALKNCLPVTLPVSMKNKLLAAMDAGRLLPVCSFLFTEPAGIGEDPDISNITCSESLPVRFKDNLVLDRVELKRVAPLTLLVRMTWHLISGDENDIVCYLHVKPSGETFPGFLVRKGLEKMKGYHLSYADDRIILGDVWPSRYWHPDDRMTEIRSIRLPESIRAGVYDVRLGVYYAWSREMLKPDKGKDHLIGSISLP